MSTSSAPSAWEKPRHFSVHLDLPLDLLASERDLYLECSATHIVVGYNNHVYLYSYPALDLVHIIEPGEHQEYCFHDIYQEILVVRYKENPTGQCQLYIWDLAAERSLGAVVSPDHWYDTKVSIPWAEMATTHQPYKWGTEDRPKHPWLIVCSKGDRATVAELQTYVLHVDDMGSKESLPRRLAATNTFPIHLVSCLTSMGTTALTGGYDATVRLWNIITGECQFVLMGHSNTVRDVSLGEERIYSSSRGPVIRVWDRHCGDCLHILEDPMHPAVDAFFLPSSLSHPYLISYTGQTTSVLAHIISVWDPVSGKLVYNVANQTGCAIGPIRGKTYTILTKDDDPESDRDWLRTRDLRSGQILASFPTAPHDRDQPFFAHDRFIAAAVKQDEHWILDVWEFGSDNSSNGDSDEQLMMSSYDRDHLDLKPSYKALDELD